MSTENKININLLLQEVGDTVMASLKYESIPEDRTEDIINKISTLIEDPIHLQKCENYFKSAGSNYVLFYISNIIYNLKTRQELLLTPDVLSWLGSVWKNFLKRNISYQKLFLHIDEYRVKFQTYFPSSDQFISQLKSIQDVKDEYLNPEDEEFNKLSELENFYNKSIEILSWMKPTYFFLLDYYYEKRMMVGDDNGEGEAFEKTGLVNFGYSNYSFKDITFITGQALGILEAVYLNLKKKKMSRRLVFIDGKKKLFSANEIHEHYLEKFNETKKELQELK